MKFENHKEYTEQVEILKDRGMIVDENTEKHLSKINYYKLKRIANFFYDEEKKQYKPGTHFNAVLANFYYDKELRMELLKLCEIIEISIKNKFSFILGKKYGWNGYLTFSNWCDRNISREVILKNQKKFIGNLKKKLKKEKEHNKIIKDFYSQYPYEKYPSIWRIVEIFTFGDIIFLIKIMSKNNKVKFSKYYDVKYNILISHLENINLIRNFCAHNNPIIDITLKTKAKLIDEFKDIIIDDRKLVISILILVHLVRIIDTNYKFVNLEQTLKKLIRTDKVAKKYGIINKNSLFDYIK